MNSVRGVQHHSLAKQLKVPLSSLISNIWLSATVYKSLFLSIYKQQYEIEAVYLGCI